MLTRVLVKVKSGAMKSGMMTRDRVIFSVTTSPTGQATNRPPAAWRRWCTAATALCDQPCAPCCRKAKMCPSRLRKCLQAKLQHARQHGGGKRMRISFINRNRPVTPQSRISSVREYEHADGFRQRHAMQAGGEQRRAGVDRAVSTGLYTTTTIPAC